MNCATDAYPPTAKEAPAVPWYTVDLDKKPEERWIHVVKVSFATVEQSMKKINILIIKLQNFTPFDSA